MSDVYMLDDGAKAVLDAETGHAAMPALYLHLFSNNVVVDGTQNAASFTKATFTGYAPIALGDPGASSIAAHIASRAFPEESFTITAGSQNIYGWVIGDATLTKAFWAQTDAAAPVAMSAAGLNNLRYTVTLQQKDSHF